MNSDNREPLQYKYRGPIKRQDRKTYRLEEIKLMTTYQLRSICRKEKIIHAAIDKMDAEELIRVIMHYRGERESLLIKDFDETGMARLSSFISRTKIVKKQHAISVPAKIVAWEGLDTNWLDQFSVTYDKDISGTNALVVNDNNEICAIMNVEQAGKNLYLTRSGKQPCFTNLLTRNYTVFLIKREYSDDLYHLYYDNQSIITPLLEVFAVSILDFFIKEPVDSLIPLSIDFGSSSTSAGLFVDPDYYQKVKDGIVPGQLKENAINYIEHFKNADDEFVSTPLLPTVVGVREIHDKGIDYVFGWEAEYLSRLSYVDESFSIFYDIKRWISDYERSEELSDIHGRRAYVKRRDIMKAFLEHIIGVAEQRFKCNFSKVYMTSPVKQKKRFLDFYREALPQYVIESELMLDEGMASLYHTIKQYIKNDEYIDNEEYEALIIDCGGGTTELSSCVFKINNNPVSYDIAIQTTYENGDTNFGGNSLTYLILQFLKIVLANHLVPGSCTSREEVIASFNMDIFRSIDKFGVKSVYESLEEEYTKAEKVIPTRFKEYEQRDRKEYYMVKNNYMFLFETAERLKKQFFNRSDTLQIRITSDDTARDPEVLIIDKWKISIPEKGKLTPIKQFKDVSVSIYEIKQILKGSIYGIMRRFLEKPYRKNELQYYEMIKLTGQSCKIPIFRDSLKEFVPGQLIQFTNSLGDSTEDHSLKLSCLNGLIEYLYDKTFGYANVQLLQKTPVIPYVLSGYSHDNNEIVLIHHVNGENTNGSISRPLESSALHLTLQDLDNSDFYKFTITCRPSEFESTNYEKLAEDYGSVISQDEIDTITDGEVKYFVWPDTGYWGFNILPIIRQKDETVKIGELQFFPFENSHWVIGFYSGMR